MTDSNPGELETVPDEPASTPVSVPTSNAPPVLPVAELSAGAIWGWRVLRALPWLIAGVPALYQLILLCTAISGRVAYPYDLEWMEGGMLHHAQRISSGEGIYVAPSIAFIPYLYTPLYPALLAMLGSLFGITYQLGRAISIVSLIGIAAVAAAQIGSRRHQHPCRGPVWAGIALSLGLFAGIYPYVEGWFDLVRGDTLFLFMVTAGLAGLPRWSQASSGLAGHAQVAAGAAVLALAFFCKQTGVIYVAAGGVIVLICAWRRLVTYVATAGVLGLGGTWILNRATDGWFWTYVSKIHRAHDFNMDRFWKSFGNILWYYPGLTIVVAIALIVVAVTRISRKTFVPQAQPLLLWSATFAISTVVGAVGWGTEFAHFNAYMPAFLHGALAAGAAVPAVYACARVLWGERDHQRAVALASALAILAPLAIACLTHGWQPKRFMPTRNDVIAGNRLIERIHEFPGDVWIPSHPWYLALAGKQPHVHRMGIKDVTTRQQRVVEGLDRSLREHAFSAIVLDQRDVHLDVPQVGVYYRPAMKLPRDERPRVYSGAAVAPDTIWVPAVTTPPPAGARVVFDFEHAGWGAWTRDGQAWGKGPVTEPFPGQGFVLGTGGRRFATSMHGSDAASGRVTSAPFALDGDQLTMRLGGGTDASKLRVELWVDETDDTGRTRPRLARVASVPEPGGSTLQAVSWDLTELTGKTGKLELVDDSPTGHLDVDDIWIWSNR
ncbi:MAG: hypothetical protein AB7P03_12310 [Kofleriaceae bacterium]